MTEYIEREAAIKELMNDAPEQVGYSREDAADCIRYMDAADVAPVRHGRWLCVDTDTEQFFLCNRCKKKNTGKATTAPAAAQLWIWRADLKLWIS